MSAEESRLKQPNLYELSGDGIQVTYSTSSFDGSSHFNYQDSSVNKLFMGEQIRTVETEIGTLVTVTLKQIADGDSTSFTLLIPRVTLNPSNSADIVTDGITTLHKGTFAGPPVGQDDFYTVHRLQGTASFVVF